MALATRSSNLSLGAVRRALTDGFDSGKVALPVLPSVSSRVMTMANDPNADVADLSDLIHQDQSLAGNVLRIANSAAYCVGEPVVSLKQAVMRLGMTTVSEIAVAACLMGKDFQTPGYETYRKRMLVHAFIAGGFGKELARQKRRNVEAMFLCGLLHSIGKPVVLRLICDIQKGARTLLPTSDAIPLVDLFQLKAAGMVAEAWGLPEQVRVTAMYHENPDQAPAFVDETLMTGLAARLATWVVNTLPGNDQDPRSFPEWEPLSFYPDEVDAVLERRKALEESASIFMS